MMTIDNTAPHGGRTAGLPDRRTAARRAFSLIEVNMALLIIGIGLTALIGLFPAALRESSLASADTSQAMFADQVLNMLHANASTITNWNDWANHTNFLQDVSVPAPAPSTFVDIQEGNHTIANYLTQGNYIVYKLYFDRPKPDIVQVWMRVADRRNTDIDKNPIYITEFVFMGM